MSNYQEWIGELGINEKKLDEKKQQTTYKIKYVVAYIREWVRVSENRNNIQNINFIDAMSNAGIYRDGDLSTAMEVLLVFFEEAKAHSDKTFNLLVNDNDSERIEILTKVACKIRSLHLGVNNVHLITRGCDVNVYLSQNNLFDKHIGQYNASTVLYVDPYNLSSVQFDRIKGFIKRYYSELIYNLFTSDFVRNGEDVLKKCLGDIKIDGKKNLMDYIENELKATGKIKYVFSYEFHISTGLELYRILFATPSLTGLEKLKDALWDTFRGKQFHRNFEENQISLFSPTQEENDMLNIHAQDAQELLTKEMIGKTVNYTRIEAFLIERTMLKGTQCITHVIKPLLEKGVITKQNMYGKSNYKKDLYCFRDVIL